MILVSQNEFSQIDAIVEDGTEAVKAKVAKRLKLLPVPVQNTAARTASELTTTKMLAKQVSLELLRKVPAGLKKKGITVDMEEIFREGPYILFQLRVLHVDTVTMAEDLMGHSSLVRWLVGHVSEGLQRTLEEEYCEYARSGSYWSQQLISTCRLTNHLSVFLSSTKTNSGYLGA